MGRAGITYSEVTKAANELIEEGSTPTIEKIRTKIGAGSYTTISALLKKWKEGYPTDQLAKTEGIPPTLAVAIKDIWAQLTEQASAQCKEIQDTATQRIDAQEQLRLTAEKAAEQLKQDNERLNNQLEQQAQQSAVLQAQLAETSQGLKDHALTIQHLHETIDTHKSENERLHTLTQQLHKNLEHFQAMTAKQRQEEQLASQEEKTRLEHQIKSLTDNLYKNQQSLENERRQNSALSDQLKIASHQINAQQSELAEQSKKQGALKQQIRDLNTEKQILNTEKQTINAEKQTLSALLGREKSHSESLQQHCEALQQRYDTILESRMIRAKKKTPKNNKQQA